MTICSKCEKEVGNNWYEFEKKPYCKICLKEVNGWYNCSKCGKKLSFSNRGGYGEKYYCQKCRNEFIKKDLEKTTTIKDLNKEDIIIEKTPQIKCPYCGKMFRPIKKTPTSTAGNIARGAVFLPWGVVKAVKNKPYVECPHCHMRIPQG